MPEIKAVFFDLDDTLINSRKAEMEACKKFKNLFKELNDVKLEDFETEWYKNAMDLYEKYNNGEITFERQRIDRVKKTFLYFNLEKNDDEAYAIFKEYLKLYKDSWQVFGDTKEVLQALQGKYKLGVITNGDSKQQREKINKVEIKGYFSEIIISSEVGVSKPNKKIFEIACKKLGEQPENCIMIGDKVKVDAQGAENAGLKAIWVNRKNEENEYENQVTELKEILKKL